MVLEGGAGGEPGAVEVDRLSARSAAVGRDAVALVARRPQALRALMVGPLTFGLRFKLLAVARRLGHVDVVHAHFAYRSADAAEVLGRALGCGHSFTAHAHDIFVDNAELGRRTGAARLVVTVCEYNRRWMAARYGAAAAAKIHVIPCSVRVDRPVATTPAADPIVLAIARLVPKKGLDTLLDAFAKLAEPARLVIVGEGPLAGELAARADRPGCIRRRARPRAGHDLVRPGRGLLPALPDCSRRRPRLDAGRDQGGHGRRAARRQHHRGRGAGDGR